MNIWLDWGLMFFQSLKHSHIRLCSFSFHAFLFQTPLKKARCCRKGFGGHKKKAITIKVLGSFIIIVFLEEGTLATLWGLWWGKNLTSWVTTPTSSGPGARNHWTLKSSASRQLTKKQNQVPYLVCYLEGCYTSNNNTMPKEKAAAKQACGTVLDHGDSSQQLFF